LRYLKKILHTLFNRKLILFLFFWVIFQLFHLNGYSETFIVSNNADSGIGTIREALQKAADNGNTTQDVISFNLPDLSESGRTITLLTELPVLSSNLVIDGSTQSGSFFGVSTAKVQLLTAFNNQTSNYGLVIRNLEKVEIYGLYVHNIAPVPSGSNSLLWQGIAVWDSKDIQIGAAGKGNVICGFPYNLGMNQHLTGGQIHHYSQNIKIKATFFNIEPDGKTVSINATTYTQLYFVYGEVEIGGINPAEGNLFAHGLYIYQANTYDDPNPSAAIQTLPATIYFRNNKVGTNFLGTNFVIGGQGLNISTSTPGGKNTIFIEDNVIANPSLYGITITNSGRDVIILRNYIGVTKTTLQPLSPANNGGTGIFIYGATGVKIGSDQTSDANYIGYCRPLYVVPTSKVSFNKNSFFCTSRMFPLVDVTNSPLYPSISITESGTGFIKGKATPKSIIELFYTDVCGTCSPETYFASTQADDTGNWKYEDVFLRSVMASATLNGYTSNFTVTRIDATQARLVNTCDATGSIKGVLAYNAQDIKWLNAANEVVGIQPDLIDVPPGTYRMVVSNGTCSAQTGTFQIIQNLNFFTNSSTIINPSCGQKNGSVKGIRASSNTGTIVNYSWTDGNGIEISKIADLLNVGAGNYKLLVGITGQNCSKTYEVTLQNTTGPNVNTVGTLATPSLCNGNTGSITGINATGTGTLKYIWTNQDGNEVGNQKNLTNQPAGIYKVEVTDQSGCSAVTSAIIEVKEINGIGLTNNGVVKNATCDAENGEIKGISVSGATSYEWYNAADQMIARGNTPDIDHLPPGIYYLKALSSTCEKLSMDYEVKKILNTTDYGLANEQIVNPHCGLPNGSIQVNLKKDIPFTYRWVNKSTGQSTGTNSNILSDLDEGAYQLFLADNNLCEKLFAEFTVKKEAVLSLDEHNMKVVPDQCNNEIGSISGIKVVGVAPIVYNWIDDSEKKIGSDPDIFNLKAGIYYLTITDKNGCALKVNITVPNQKSTIDMPDVSDIKLCSKGKAILLVTNVSNLYKYKLYAGKDDVIPLDEQSSGIFQINVDENKIFYLSKLTGSCESERKAVKVTIGDEELYVPNTFTPNQDGDNDFWLIRGIESYPTAKLAIFNRDGQKVFESNQYSNTFDGSYRGTPLPSGTYYFILNLNSDCNPITGGITIIR
jgi:gliding motility-associated-like protein